MRSPGLAIIWEQWRQTRLVLGFLIMIVAAFAGVFRTAVGRGWNENDAGIVGAWLVIITLALSIFYLVLSRHDVNDVQVRLPARLLALPVPSWVLVAWLFVYRFLAISLLCVAFSSICVFFLGSSLPLELGSSLPLKEMIVICIALLAICQAIVWVIGGIGLACIVASLPIWGDEILQPLSENHWTVNYLIAAICIAVAYNVAILGVSLQRRGTPSIWSYGSEWLEGVTGWSAARDRTFSTPEKAQFWFEWRRRGYELPLFCGLLVLMLTGLNVTAKAGAFGLDRSLFRELDTSILVLIYFTVPCLATLIGLRTVSFKPGRRWASLTTFVATRPVTNRSMAWATLKMATSSLVVSYAVIIVGLILWLFLWGSDTFPSRLSARQVFSSEFGIFLGTTVVVAWVLLWYGRVLSFVCAGMVFLVFLGQEVLRLSDNTLETLKVLLICAAALTALVGVAWAYGKAYQRQLLKPMVFWVTACVWIAVVASYAVSLWETTDKGWVPLWICAVVLPLGPLLTAPLKLERNRHR